MEVSIKYDERVLIGLWLTIYFVFLVRGLERCTINWRRTGQSNPCQEIKENVTPRTHSFCVFVMK